MKDHELVHQQVEQLRNWISTTGATATRSRQQDGEVLRHLEDAVEELSVSEEELRVQHDELRGVTEQLAQERARYLDMFSAAPDAYLITDSHAVIREANAAAGEMFGLSHDRLSGKPISVFLSPGEKKLLWARLAALDEQQDTGAEWTLTLTRRDGASVPVGIRQSAVPGTREIRWILRDLTDRQRAEDAERKLRQEQAERRAAQAAAEQARFLSDSARVLNDAGDLPLLLRCVGEQALPLLGEVALVDIVTADGNVRRSATAALPDLDGELRAALQELHGLTPGGRIRSAVGGSEADIVPSLDEVELSEMLTPASATQLHAAGFDTAAILPLTLRGEPLGVLTLLARGIGRSCARNLLVARAYADSAAIALHNHALLADAQRANRVKAHFISVMSHEFRTPLTSIAGYADVLDCLVHGPLTDKQQVDVQRLRQSAWHLSQLVDQILDISREESRPEQLKMERCDLRDLLTEVGAVLAPQAAVKDLAMAVDAGVQPAIVETDPGRVRQILLNLIGNAIKFTCQGAVYVSLRALGDEFEIAVRDTGIGIPEDSLERVFEPFYREREQDDIAGTGLGLTVTRALTERLGGRLTVESRHRVGSTFRLRLPRKQPEN